MRKQIWCRRALALGIALAALMTSLVGISSPASAATLDYPHANLPCVWAPYNVSGPCSGYSWGTIPNNDSGQSIYSSRGYAYRNCTDYVAWRLQSLGVADTHTRGLGNGGEWYTRAVAKGLPTGTTPAVGAAAVAPSGGYGHVAYVEIVHGDGTITITEYNFDMQGTGSTRRVNPATAGFTKYVYFASFMSTPPNTSGVNARLMGDVNGDGLSDAVVMFGASGEAKVALSTGSGFGYPGSWSYGHSTGADVYWLADVTGDGKADLIAYYAGARKWFVSASSGSGFWAAAEWSNDIGQPVPDRAFFADVTGDGKADKILFSGGTWLVGSSSGSGFWTLQTWISGHGVGSNDQLVGDFNGDNLADAAIYGSTSGKWYVALSTGGGFGYPGEWASGHGVGTAFRLAGDVNGDNKDDIAYYSSGNYKWYVGTAASTGGFWAPAEWSYDGPGFANSNNDFLADVTGDGRVDKIRWYRDSGSWYVGTAAASGGFWAMTPWIQGHGANS